MFKLQICHTEVTYCSQYTINVGRPHRDRIPVRARFSAPVQTGSGAHPASHTMGSPSFPGVKRPRRAVDHPPHLAPRLRNSRDILLLPFRAFVVCYRVNYGDCVQITPSMMPQSYEHSVRARPPYNESNALKQQMHRCILSFDWLPASEFYVPTFRYTLFHLHRCAFPAYTTYEDGTDSVFRNVCT
jgi:hypothetical protein